MKKPPFPAFLLSKNYPTFLLGAFTLWFLLWALHPKYPSTFFLEHVLTVLLMVYLVWNHFRFRLSNLSYSLIFTFLLLHVIGGHYSYSEVPYEAWVAWLGSLFGHPEWSLDRCFGFERNMFDRLVHFSFGLLFAYPVREIFVRVARVKGFWGYYLPLDVMMAFSMIYELIEWGAAVGFGGDLGQSFLGTQGDIWDAHKDMALASTGALITMVVAAFVNRRLQRDFAQEWSDSLSSKRGPMGEARIQKLLGKKR
jgi:putative membrane protein